MPSTSLISEFEQALQQEKLIRPRDRVGIACSGGPDSTALFYLLSGISKKWSLKLRLLHFNHSLRPQSSKRDENFVRRLAKAFDVPLDAGRENVARLARQEQTSLEEAGRRARYRFFIQAARKRRISKIALGHTQDDQAETVLMRVIQGTGLKGLCGIRKKIKMGGIAFVRPLLDYPKKKLKIFLKERRIAYCTDLSNHSPRFLRNRLRRELLPWLSRRVNPRAVEAIARIPAIVSEDVKLLARLEDEAWEKCFRSKRKKKLVLSRKNFLRLHPSLQFRLLDRALKTLDTRSGLNFDLWQKLKPHLARSKYRSSLPRNIDLALAPAKMILYKRFASA